MATRESISVAWVWQQVWTDLLFLHWPVEADALRPHFPDLPNAKDLVIDTWRGEAWVSLVLFRLLVRPSWLPGVPGFSSLLEANLRTYVTLRGQPGIQFLSMHADNRWAIALARLLVPLPYEAAAVSYAVQGDRLEWKLQSRSRPDSQLALTARLRCSSVSSTAEGTLDAWLLERYLAFVPGRQGLLEQGSVAHPRWATAPADVQLTTSTLGHRFGLDLDRPPAVAQYCRKMAARFSRFQTVVAIPAGRVEPLERPVSGSKFQVSSSQHQAAS